MMIPRCNPSVRSTEGNAFFYYGATSSCAPNIDIPGLWALTNAVRFPPGDDGPDLVATFHEWDVSGTGEITWNDFVREMTTRINDPNHYEAELLPETIDMLGEIPDMPLGDGWQGVVHGASDEGYEDDGNARSPSSSPRKSKAKAKRKSTKAKAKRKSQKSPNEMDMAAELENGTWKETLANVAPTQDEDGALSGPWGDAIEAAVKLEAAGGWEEKFPDAPVGLIIQYLVVEIGLADFAEAADLKEQSCKA